MPKTEMNTLFRQYRALLENNGNELPGSPSGLREQLEEKPYQELNEFEKLMLFLAVYEEKAPSTAPRLKKDIGYQDLVTGDQFIKSPEQLEETVKGFFSREVRKGFKHYVVDNTFALKRFESPEEKQLLSDVAAIAGMEKELSDALAPAEQKVPEEAEPLAPDVTQMDKSVLETMKAFFQSEKHSEGSTLFETMRSRALEIGERDGKMWAWRDDREQLIAACKDYITNKEGERYTQKGRERFQMAMTLLGDLMDPADFQKEIDRVNRVRSAKWFGRGGPALSAEDFRSQKNLAELRSFVQPEAGERVAADAAPEAPEAAEPRDAAALAREQQLSDALRLFGVPQDRLDNIAARGTEGIEFDGTPEFRRMAKATLAAFAEQKATGKIAPEHARALRDAAIFYCDRKPAVRTFQSGRDRFDMALNVMTLVSDPSDLKMRKCFDRINAARKAKPGDKSFVTADSHYTEAELKESRERARKLNSRRVAALTTAEAIVTDRLTMMGEKTTAFVNLPGHDKKVETKVTKDMLRNDCINKLGEICMDAIVKQQEAKKNRGADGLPTTEELKQHGIAYRTLLAATLAETVYSKDDTVRTTQLDLRTQEIIKRYDLNRKLDEIRLDTPEQIIATKNALKEVAVAFCKEKNIPVADAPGKRKDELPLVDSPDLVKQDLTH